MKNHTPQKNNRSNGNRHGHKKRGLENAALFPLKEASIRETAREKSNRSGMQTKINLAVLAAASLNAWFLKTDR